MTKRLPIKVALLCIAAVFTLTMVANAFKLPPVKRTTMAPKPAGFKVEWKDGVLQPLPDGFPKRAITIVNVDDPGTRDGIYARLYQQVLKGISPVDILVTDEPAPSFGNFYRMKELTSRVGGVQGYYPQVITTFGMVTDPLAEPIVEELGIGIDDLKMIFTNEFHPYVIVQRKDAPWGISFEGLMAYAKKNPGKLKYLSNEVGSGHDILGEWIMKHFGFRKYIKKIPMGSLQEIGSTLGAGEGDFGIQSPDWALSFWQAGKNDLIASTGSAVPPPWDKTGAVTLESLGFPKLPVGTVMSLGVAKDVPNSHVWWLYELFKAGAKTAPFQARTKQIPGCTIKFYDPPAANELKYQLYEYAEPVLRSIGMHIEDQK
jgi:tripartite-type tricarboxylate transporter receptor subunit TctC